MRFFDLLQKLILKSFLFIILKFLLRNNDSDLLVIFIQILEIPCLYYIASDTICQERIFSIATPKFNKAFSFYPSKKYVRQSFSRDQKGSPLTQGRRYLGSLAIAARVYGTSYRRKKSIKSAQRIPPS